MLLSRHQNAGLNRGVKIVNKSFENVAKFRYLGMIVTNKTLIQGGIKRRLNSGNACYHSGYNHLFSRLLSKSLKIRIYKTIFICEGCILLRLLLIIFVIDGTPKDYYTKL
jgi:hypothetical protein